MALSHDLHSQAYGEIIELFASGADVARIIAFHPSEQTAARARELLLKNSAGTITEEELAELDQFAHIEHLMRLIKARARTYLQQ